MVSSDGSSATSAGTEMRICFQIRLRTGVPLLRPTLRVFTRGFHTVRIYSQSAHSHLRSVRASDPRT